MICKIYARIDGSIAHIWDMDYGTPDVNTTLVVEFNIDDYPTEYQTLTNNAHLLTWDGANVNLNGEAILDAAWIAARQVELTTEQRELSFVDAMRPIIRAWHQGTQTTAQALASAQVVLDTHTVHKTVMNTRIWADTRLIVNPLANVTLANISGNVNAEAAYLDALFAYVSRVQVWRKLE